MNSDVSTTASVKILDQIELNSVRIAIPRPQHRSLMNLQARSAVKMDEYFRHKIIDEHEKSDKSEQ